MNDFITDYGWVVWLAIALLLVIVELVSLDLVLLMFGLGALAAAAATAAGVPFVVAAIFFAVVSVALLFVLRPPLVAKLHDGPTLTTGHGNLVGSTAVVVEPVDQRGGRVQLRGELWSARSLGDSTFDTGAEVLVTQIDGATAVVATSSSTSTSTKES